MIHRRQLLQGLAAAPLLAPGVALAAAARPLTATDVHPSNYPTVAAVRWIGEQLEAATDGRVRIRLYHSGQLGRESDAIDMARFGALDIVRVYAGALNNAFPLTQALCLPSLFQSTDHLRRVLDGEVGAAVLADFARRDLVGLAIYDCGARCFYNTIRPIERPQDLHGLKFRVPPSDIFMRLLRELGANPTPLAYGEVYSALETRLIDGAENNLRSFHASRHFEAAGYWSESAHSYAPDLLLISRRSFEALRADDQALLRELATRSVGLMRQLWDAGEAEASAALAAAGVRRNPIDTEAFGRALAPLLDDYRRDPTLSPLITRIRSEAAA
jgi:tripartite ATP-independent transporter DctP family solute receptor